MGCVGLLLDPTLDYRRDVLKARFFVWCRLRLVEFVCGVSVLAATARLTSRTLAWVFSAHIAYVVAHGFSIAEPVSELGLELTKPFPYRGWWFARAARSNHPRPLTRRHVELPRMRSCRFQGRMKHSSGCRRSRLRGHSSSNIYRTPSPSPFGTHPACVRVRKRRIGLANPSSVEEALKDSEEDESGYEKPSDAKPT